jgi:hypothetical protein
MTGITACWARTASGHAAVRHFNRVELHPAPQRAKAGLQNSESAQISREVVERFYRVLAARSRQ